MNGLTVCAVSYPAIKSVVIRSIVFTGSIYEGPANNGISHLLEHMLFRGNARLGDSYEMNRKLEELGGELNAATSFDITEFWYDFHIEYLSQGIERFCQFLRYPVFENLSLEKSVILEEIRSDYNEENRLIDIDTITASCQWPDHSMGLPVIGCEASLAAITREDLVRWFETYYRPGNMLIAIAGDINTTAVTEMITDQFADLSASPRQSYLPLNGSEDAGNMLRLVFDKDNQFRIEWSFNSYPLTSRTRVLFQLLRRILDDGSSSRLQQNVREEKGLVYDISADTFFFESGVSLSIQSMVSRDRFDALIGVLTGLIQRLIDDGVTESEFSLAKRRYLATLDCNSDTAQGVLFETMAPLVYPRAKPISDVIQVLNEVSLSEINSLIQRIFRRGKSCFVVVGPWDDDIRRSLGEKLQSWIDG